MNGAGDGRAPRQRHPSIRALPKAHPACRDDRKREVVRAHVDELDPVRHAASHQPRRDVQTRRARQVRRFAGEREGTVLQAGLGVEKRPAQRFVHWCLHQSRSSVGCEPRSPAVPWGPEVRAPARVEVTIAAERGTRFAMHAGATSRWRWPATRRWSPSRPDRSAARGCTPGKLRRQRSTTTSPRATSMMWAPALSRFTSSCGTATTVSPASTAERMPTTLSSNAIASAGSTPSRRHAS